MNKQDRASEINTSGGAYVGGGVSTAGGNFVGRDQSIAITNTQQGVTLAEFAQLLAEMRTLLPEAGLDSGTADVIDADVKVVEAQLAQPKPSAPLITSRLEGITKLLTAAAGAAAAGEKLLPLAQQAVAWAGQLFH